MIVALCIAAALAAAESETGYINASLELEGRLLDQRFVELAPGGGQSLCVAVRLPGGKRELRFHSLDARGLDARPKHVIPVLEDVIAYGLLREDYVP